MSQTFKNCCTGGDAGDLTQSIVNAAESLQENAAKLNTFTNGTETQTVNLGGVVTKTVRGLVKSFADPMTGYVSQAAASAASANASKNAAAASAAQALSSKNAAEDAAGVSQLSAASARVSASDASVSASKAKWYADTLEGVDETLAEHRLSIARNAQGLDDLSWLPWGVAIAAVRSAHSAITQAIKIFAAETEHQEALSRADWRSAITACRNTASAIRQAVEIAKLYRLVDVLAAGGGRGGGGMTFVPDQP